jgi:hypothetical protein
VRHNRVDEGVGVLLVVAANPEAADRKLRFVQQLQRRLAADPLRQVAGLRVCA